MLIYRNIYLQRWCIFLLILFYLRVIDSLVTVIGVIDGFFYADFVCLRFSQWNSFRLYLDYNGGFVVTFLTRYNLRIWLGESLIAEFHSPLFWPGSVVEFQWLFSTAFPTIFVCNLIMVYVIFILIWTSKGVSAHIMRRI
jgi:hypothetical protein